MEDKIVLGGAIEGDIGYDDIAGSSIVSNLKKTKYTFISRGKQQRRQGTSECVPYAAMGCIADNSNIVISDTDIQAMRVIVKDYGWTIKGGMYLAKGGDLRVNLFKKVRNIQKITINTYTDDFKRALELGYSVMFGSYINKDYINDINTDGDIDIVFGSGTGHARRIFKHPDNGNYYIVENFVGTLKHNIIEVTPTMLDNLLASKVLFYQSFIFLVEEIEDKTPWWKKKVKEYQLKYGKSM